MTPTEALERIDALMREASKLSGEIGKDFGSHPAMFAVNRAWHSLGAAHDAMERAKRSAELCDKTATSA